MKEIYHPKSLVACVKIKQDENNNDSGITDLNINVWESNDNKEPEIVNVNPLSRQDEELILPSVKKIATLFQDHKNPLHQNKLSSPTAICLPKRSRDTEAGGILYRIISPIISAVGCNIFITQDSPGGSPPGMLMVKGQSCHLSPSQSQVCSCFPSLDIITCHTRGSGSADNQWSLTWGYYGHLYPLLLQSQAGDRRALQNM